MNFLIKETETSVKIFFPIRVTVTKKVMSRWGINGNYHSVFSGNISP